MGPARCAPWIVASTSPVATSTATSAGALGATRAQATVDGVAQHSADTCAPNVCARRHEFRDTSTTTRHPRSSTAATTELDGSMATDVNRSRSVDDARTGRLRTVQTTPSWVMIGGLPVTQSRPRVTLSLRVATEAMTVVFYVFTGSYEAATPHLNGSGCLCASAVAKAASR